MERHGRKFQLEKFQLQTAHTGQRDSMRTRLVARLVKYPKRGKLGSLDQLVSTLHPQLVSMCAQVVRPDADPECPAVGVRAIVEAVASECGVGPAAPTMWTDDTLHVAVPGDSELQPSFFHWVGQSGNAVKSVTTHLPHLPHLPPSLMHPQTNLHLPAHSGDG